MKALKKAIGAFLPFLFLAVVVFVANSGVTFMQLDSFDAVTHIAKNELVPPAVVAQKDPEPQKKSQEDANLEQYLRFKWNVPSDLAEVVVKAANANGMAAGIPTVQILAIIATESSFNPGAMSKYGAQGLMQVVPRWHPDKLKDKPEGALFDPVHNIEVGTKVLKEYLIAFNGDHARALRKYSGSASSYKEKVKKYEAAFIRAMTAPTPEAKVAKKAIKQEAEKPTA